MGTPSSNEAAVVEAIRERDLDAFRKLLPHIPDLNATLPGTDRPLLKFALDRNASDIALALIDAGADLTNSDLNLLWAIQHKRADIVRKFIDAGADVNMRAIMGTPICVAAAWGMA